MKSKDRLLGLSVGMALVLAWCCVALGSESADDLFAKGRDLHRSGKIKEAVEWYDKALKVDIRHFNAMLASGLAYYALEDYATATEKFEDLLSFYPGNRSARLYLAHSLLNRGSVEQSKNLFAQIVSDDPTNVSALIGQGKAEFLAGNRFAATESFKKALALQPQNQSLRESLAALEASNVEYIRAAEAERKQRIKSALNNAIAEASAISARARAIAEASQPSEGLSAAQRMSWFELTASPELVPDARGSRTDRGRSGKDRVDRYRFVK